MNLTDVGAMLEDFASPYMLTRAGAVDFDSDPGRPTAATPTTVAITAVVTPASMKDLQRLPEGLRTESVRVVYTATQPLLTPQPDTIALEGATWQFEQVDPWLPGAFFKAMVRKVG